MKTIRVTCDTRDTLPFDALEVFQGSLKKRNDEDYRKIRESIEKHGFAAPFFVWKDGERNRLLDGTGRHETLEIMRREGYELPPLPVVYLAPQDEAEARELLLKITSRYGKVSAKGLAEFLKGLELDLSGLDLGVFIKPKDLPAALGIIPRTAPEPVTKPGDVIELVDAAGNVRHRLACGDARREETWAALMGNERAALLFTDPPYGVDYGEKVRDIASAAHKRSIAREASGAGDDVKGDNLDAEGLRVLWRAAFRNARRYTREGASFYVCGGSYPNLIQAQLTAMAEAGLPPKHLLIWCKQAPAFSMGRLDYDYQHELIWYGWNGAHHFYGQGQWKTTLWHYARPVKSNLHPTQKPPELAEEAIKNSLEPVEKARNGVINNTGKDAIVLDPFAGSGSTMAACEKLKRRCFMLELEPRYCDTIALRALNINPSLAAYRTRQGRREAVTKAELEGGAND
jgi:DNA modification methylase